MADPAGDRLQDTAAVLREKLQNRRRAIGSLGTTGEFQTDDGSLTHGQGTRHRALDTALDETNETLLPTPKRRTLPPMARQDDQTTDSPTTSPLRMSHLQPVAEGNAPSPLPALDVGGSPASDFAALRKRRAKSRQHQAEQGGIAQSSATATGDASLHMSADLRDRLRSKIAAAKLKKQEGNGQAHSPLLKPSNLSTGDGLQSPSPSPASIPKARSRLRKAVGFAAREDVSFFGYAESSNATEQRRAPMSADQTPMDESNLVESGFATATSLTQQVALEEEIYFQPSNVFAPVTDKLPRDCAPRYLDQEGIFTGGSPPMSPANQARAENRLLKQGEEALHWFGGDGRLICLPDPVKVWPERQVEWWLDAAAGHTELYFHPTQLDPDTRLRQLHSKQWCLTFNIESMAFAHHPLFSAEHVLASRLTQYHTAHSLRKGKNTVSFLTDKLKAVKLATIQLHATLRMGGAGAETDAITKQLYDYRIEIRRIRQLRDGECLREKQLVKNMFGCWLQLKSLRQQQGYSSTGVKLILKKETVDKENDQRQWQEEVDEEVEELRLESEKQHQVQMEEYRRHKSAYRQQIEQAAAGHVPSSPQQPDISKPQKPVGFDEEACRASVQENALKNRRRPGNPLVTPVLETNIALTSISSCPRNEQARRREVLRQNYFVRIFIDGHETAQTMSKSLDHDFVIRFKEAVKTHPGRWPGSMRLQIVEDNYLQTRQVSEVFLAVPSRHVSVNDAVVEKVEFTSEKRMTPSMLTAVGSGSVTVPVIQTEASSGPVCYELRETLTSADIRVSCGWNLDPITGRPAAPPEFDDDTETQRKHQPGDAIGALGMAGIADAQKLATWIDDAKLDPNDPRNLNLLQSVKDYAARSQATMQSFRLSALERSTHFATDKELDSDRRFRLIRLRTEQQSKQSHRGHKEITVPNSALQVSALQLQDAEAVDELPEPQFDEVESISARRRRGQQLLMEARRRVSERAQSMQTQVRKEYVIQEDPMPDIGSFILSVLSLFNPFGSLPDNKEKQAQRGTPSGTSSGNVNVRVQVLRANRLPQRANVAEVDELQHVRGRQRPPAALRPFVEVSFQRQKQRTEVAEGTDPEWNDSLTFQLSSEENSSTSAGLATINDLVYFNMFDEQLIDLLQDERKRDTNIHQRIQRHWLGSFSLPFQTLYARSQVSGTFQLQVPLVLLGYQLYQPEESVLPWWLQRGNQRLDRPCLTVNITLEPRLAPLPSIHLTFETSEERRLIKMAHQWASSLASKFPGRKNWATVVDLNGRTVFLTRYIAKQGPPSQVWQSQDNTNVTVKQLERAAHFVSMIPFVSDATAFSGTCDLWATSEEFLEMLSGDEEEHAVLLCNYFLCMRQQAWLLIGSAIPEGDTAFVLVSSLSSTGKVNYELWKPSTGEHFGQYDTLCPLQDVYFVCNDSNIWANVQSETRPSQISFDLSNSSKWRPFFASSFPAPELPSVQTPRIQYDHASSQFSKELQVILEQRLMGEMMGWRERQVTRWNRYCSQALKELLPRFEANPYDTPVSTTNQQLSNILKSYRLTGFPLHMPFTDMSSVVEALHSTGLHLSDDPKVEFALAVYAHVYPNEVASLWVYVASVFKR